MTGIFAVILALLLGYQVSQLMKTYDFRYLWWIALVTFLLFVTIVAGQTPPQYVPVGP